jgi:hypothetical protein
MSSHYYRCFAFPAVRLVRTAAGIALLSCVLFQLPLGAQTPVIRARKTPGSAWKRGPKRQDYIPPAGSTFPDVTYNGGPLVAHASYWMVYWGSYWTSGLGLSQRNHFNNFVATVAPSAGFTGQFAEYQEPGYPILAGSFAGEIAITTGLSGTSIDDTAITAQISAWILSGVLPVPDANTVYVIMTPAGMDVTQNSQSACGDFFGYHNDAVSPAGTFGYYRYIVLPYQNCGADTAADGPVTINGMTDTLSHEMAETETDPDVSYLTLGWIDLTSGNEIADICSDNSATYGYQNFWFQKVWSDAAGTCIGAVSGSPSIHLTISTMGQVFPGVTEPSGAANILPSFPTTFTVTTDSATPISLSVSGLPAGVTYNLNPSTVSATSSASLEISTNASPGPSGTATVTATSGSQQAQFQFLVIPWIQVSTVNVTSTSFVYNSAGQSNTGSITIENTGSQPIGPTILLGYHGLDNRIHAAAVAADGVTYDGIQVGPTGDYTAQFPDGVLGPGQSVTQNVAFNNPFSVAIDFTPQVFVVAAPSACDISQNGPNVVDVQLIINEALGVTPAADDLNVDGLVNVIDVQLVTNAALGLGCSAGTS